MPRALWGRLAPYQQEGVAWTLTTLEREHGCILGDEPGLGKTVQAIAAAVAMARRGALRAACIIC